MREAGEWALLLAEACAGDESLRREVESLLPREGRTNSSMGAPAWAAKPLAQEKARAGGTANPDPILRRTVSHYPTLKKLGGAASGRPL